MELTFQKSSLSYDRAQQLVHSECFDLRLSAWETLEVNDTERTIAHAKTIIDNKEDHSEEVVFGAEAAIDC